MTLDSDITTPSAYQAVEHHTAADQGSRLLEVVRRTAADPAVAVRTHPAEGTDQEVEHHTDLVLEVADRTVRPEEADHTGPEEAGRTAHLEEVRRIAETDRNLAEEVRHRTGLEEELRSHRVRGGWSSRP
jgi:hypothetical protein